MSDTNDDYHFAEEHSLAPFHEDCRMLGSMLDDCVKQQVGPELQDKLERVRVLSSSLQALETAGHVEASEFLEKKLIEELTSMSIDDVIPLGRACGHYLNLTGIAEIHHRVRRMRANIAQSMSCDEMFGKLIAQGAVTPDQLYSGICKQQVEVVLTAHPTQVIRRTLQYKHTRISAALEKRDRPDLTEEETMLLMEDIRREITALWHTDELRRSKPTPIDEARGGLFMVEQSLWSAIPSYLRRVSAAMKKHTGMPLPLDAVPVRFASWMGGDRDGNPNVTHKVTMDVVRLARWMACELYLREIESLRFELSMNTCSDDLLHLAEKITFDEEGEGDHYEGAATAGMQKGEWGRQGMPVGHMAGWVNRDQEESHPPNEMLHGPGPASLEGHYDQGSIAPRMPKRGSLASEQVPMKALFPDHILRESPEASRPGTLNGPLPTTPLNAAALAAAAAAAASPASTGLKKGDSLDAKGMLRADKGKGTSIEALMNPRRRGLAPYRVVLGHVRTKLQNTRRRLEELMHSHVKGPVYGLASQLPYYEESTDLLEPLMLCYNSLHECGAGNVAEGRLQDLIRRVHTFGLMLLKTDIRQESERHTDALDEVTKYLGLGSYAEWSEDARITWLVAELQGRRPLIPPNMHFRDDAKEVMETFRTIGVLGSNSLGAYVISMASRASDVLAVELLQREARAIVKGEGLPTPGTTLRVVPLFETLKDLDSAAATLRTLFSVPWYRQHLSGVHDNHQEIMLGYSDSGKDAGRLAANWALFKAQEVIVAICLEHGVRCTLFHGRGGSVGRGGGPMYLAINSQPPGSVDGSLRVTEQGEMVQTKFGLPAVALRQLEIYTTAVLTATVDPPELPRHAEWRTLMDDLGVLSCEAYRNVVESPLFIKYFSEATPVDELGLLNIGSRPARRKKTAALTSLRAIPWIFAWTQTRLNLPGWLGVGEALRKAAERGHMDDMKLMYREWPFFQSTIDLIEMILAKTDSNVARRYDEMLCKSDETRAIGAMLRDKLAETVQYVLEVSGHRALIENNTTLGELIKTRKPFMDPINILQMEVLKRSREDPSSAQLRNALLITINGIAAGMRNTG